MAPSPSFSNKGMLVGTVLNSPVLLKHCLTGRGKRTWERKSLKKRWLWVSPSCLLYEFIHQNEFTYSMSSPTHWYFVLYEFSEIIHMLGDRHSENSPGDCSMERVEKYLDLQIFGWIPCATLHVPGAQQGSQKNTWKIYVWKRKSALQCYYCTYSTYCLAMVLQETHEWDKIKIDVGEFRTVTTTCPYLLSPWAY